MPGRAVHIRTVEVRGGRVLAAELRRLARYVLGAEGVAPAVEVEVVLADEATVRDLNRLYRGRDEPTDVLSFPAMEVGATLAVARDEASSSARPEALEGRGPVLFVEPPGTPSSLGEVVICLPVAEAQARATGHPVASSVAHLLVHALLHLLAYDHEASYLDGAVMQAREDELLAALSYAGQYEHGH